METVIPETTHEEEFTSITEYTEFPVTTLEIDQQSVDSMLEEIVINSRQTAECSTTLVAFGAFLFIYLIGRFLFSVFRSILS